MLYHEQLLHAIIHSSKTILWKLPELPTASIKKAWHAGQVMTCFLVKIQASYRGLTEWHRVSCAHRLTVSGQYGLSHPP